MKTTHGKQHIVNGCLGLVLLAFLLSLAYYLPPTNLALAQGAEYTLLEELPLGPGGTMTKTTTAGEYIPGIVMLIVGIAGVLAVIKIIFGGITYMSTDAIGGKSEGKQHIQDALWGLLLIISAYVILNTINPRLLKIDLRISEVTTTDLSGGAITNNPYGELHGPFLAWAEGCRDCVRMNSPRRADRDTGEESGYDSKGTGHGCATVNPVNNAPAAGGLCLVNRGLDQKLSNLANELAKVRRIGTNGWWVTEGYPPTVTHQSACHNYGATGGTCVDIALRNPQGPQRPNLEIYQFLRAIDESGLVWLYEVPNDERLNQLKRMPQLDAWIRQGKIQNRDVPEHAHVR